MEITKNLETIRLITEKDDQAIADIIRKSLEKFHLDIPGTVYFDPQLDHLSSYYTSNSEKRAYFVVVDDIGKVLGGIGIDEFPGFERCAEIQKLYLTEEVQGKGLGKALMETAEEYAVQAGYERLYLETHTNLEAAIHLYEKSGFHKIQKPGEVQHSTMNLFFAKELT
nr:GNAT family N-acetyltransferase [uncultured Blautia sp.]